MCINIDIVLHHATIKQYFDSFLTRRETLGCVGQKCVRPPPPQFFLTGTPMQAAQKPLTMAAKLRQVYSPPHTKVGVLWE